MRKILFIFVVLILGSPQGLFAESYSKGNLKISNIWARATPNLAQTAAVYIERLHNLGLQTDHLVNISSAIAKKNLIHKTIVENGIAKMLHLKELKIHAGQTLRFKPGGLHIMMLGIQKPLKGGTTFPLTLNFKEAGNIEVIVEVRDIGFSPIMKMDHKKEHQH